MDNTANLVDKEAIIDLLETASDYECGLTRLNLQQKSLVDKLKELGGAIKKTRNKRKSMGWIFFAKMKPTYRNRT